MAIRNTVFCSKVEHLLTDVVAAYPRNPWELHAEYER